MKQTYREEARMASGSGKPRTYQMVVAKANHRKTRTLLLLKDYLRDDLSSCSSSGFRSLPRRQCCLQQLQPRASAKSVLQKALEALFNAIKSRNKGGVGVLSRSFFWKKASKRESISTCSLTDAEMEGSVTTTNTCSVTNSARVSACMHFNYHCFSSFFLFENFKFGIPCQIWISGRDKPN